MPDELWHEKHAFGRLEGWLAHELHQVDEREEEFDLEPLARQLALDINAGRAEWEVLQELRGTAAKLGMGEPARLLRSRAPEERDWFVPGLIARGGVTLIGGREKLSGKALALDTPIPTPKGWTTQGALIQGQSVFDENGKPCRVVSTTNVLHGRPCYRVHFENGESIVADAQHHWTVRRRSPGKRYDIRTVTTEDIANDSPNAANFIKVNGPLTYTHRSGLPLHPYLLGAWLGDGSTQGGAIHGHVQDEALLFRCVELYGAGEVRCFDDQRIAFLPKLHPKLRAIDAAKKEPMSKRIPRCYLEASYDDRLELLRGYMDTDGSVNNAGYGSFCTVVEELRDQLVELINSLGYKTHTGWKQPMREGKPWGKVVYGGCFTVTDGQQVAWLQHKQHNRVGSGPLYEQPRWTRIVKVERTNSVPVRCIQVSSPSGLYLAGRSMVPTHNSTLVFNLIGALERREATLFGPAYKEAVKTLIITEEPEYAIQDKADRFDLLDTWIVQDWAWPLDKVEGGTLQERWVNKLVQVEQLAAATGCAHVVIDPLSRIAAVEDEAGRELGMRAEAISSFAYRSRLAVTVVHHMNKRTDSASEDRFRGSTSLTAAVDQMVTIERRGRKNPRRRYATSYGRVEEANWERAFELAEDGITYSALDPEADAHDEMRADLLLIRSMAGGQTTIRQFCEALCTDPEEPSAYQSARRRLDKLVDASLVDKDRDGRGRVYVARTAPE